MSHSTSDEANLSLAAVCVLASYLTHRCWTPPTPYPTVTGPNPELHQDTVGPRPRALQVRRFFTVDLWAWQISLTLLYPATPKLLCPKPNNLSSSLYNWSPFTITVLSIILLAAPIRLLAIKQLGRNFTFRLAKPKELITTGLYAYVQHPSYPADWLVLTSNIALLLRLDGVLGCVLPGSIVRWGMWTGGLRVWPLMLTYVGIVSLYAVWLRVKDEEAMLQKEYGTTWEQYSRRTKRFISGVF